MFAKCSLLLALLVATASATPVTQDNSLIGYSDAVGMFLHAWQKMIPCGSAVDDIPVMAPLTMDFLPFDYSNGDTSIVGNLSNIRISGLNNFQILSGGYNDSTQRAFFDVIFPQLQILGAYELEGTFGVGGVALPIRQSVAINKKILDWRFIGAYSFAQSQSNSNGLQISEFDLSYLIGGVKADNWNKFMDVATNNYLNNFIETFSVLFSEEIQPYVNTLFATYSLPTINELLANFSLTQLTEFFVMQAELWNSADCQVKA